MSLKDARLKAVNEWVTKTPHVVSLEPWLWLSNGAEASTTIYTVEKQKTDVEIADWAGSAHRFLDQAGFKDGQKAKWSDQEIMDAASKLFVIIWVDDRRFSQR